MAQNIEYPRLRGRIYEKYQTQTDLADEMGVDRQWLHARLSGKVRFRQEDIDRISKFLKIIPDMVGYYFANKEQVARDEQEALRRWQEYKAMSDRAQKDKPYALSVS